MNESEFVTALDLGSSAFRAVVAGPARDDSIVVWATACVPAEGMREGRPTDLPAVAAAVRALLDKVWEDARVDAGPVVVAVAGDEIRSLDTQVSMSLDGRGVQVEQRHLDVLDQRIRAIDVSFDRVILHSLPVEYSVDDRGGLENPVGLVGTRLSLEAHVITASQSSVGAVRQAVAMAGADVAEIVYSGCAAAGYLLEPAAREQGALLVDVGAETTQFGLYSRGSLRKSGSVPLGGDHVTRDLAWGLDMDRVAAERVKRRWGTALRTRPAPVGNDRSTAPDPETLARLGAISEARQQEILELVAQALQWGINRPKLGAGVVLTGGGARLRATAELAEQVFGVQSACRRAPEDDQATHPESWVVALGLSWFALKEQRERPGRLATGTDGHPSVFRPLRRLIGRLV
jgi:cell division protein FtsA